MISAQDFTVVNIVAKSYTCLTKERFLVWTEPNGAPAGTARQLPVSAHWRRLYWPIPPQGVQLERVRLGVKQPSDLKLIEKALDEVAEHAGMSREDLVDLTVPTFDLEGGRRRISVGP